MNAHKGSAAGHSLSTAAHPKKWGATLAGCVLRGFSGWVCRPLDELIGPEALATEQTRGGAEMERTTTHVIDRGDEGCGTAAKERAAVQQEQERSAARTTRILLAYNGSELSRTALQVLVEQHRPQNSEVEVLYAVPVHVWDGPGSQTQEVVEEAARVLRAAGFAVHTSVLKGATSDAIVDAATAWGADLIVLGWHGRSALRRFWSGSMAEAVTHHVGCSVELVRARPDAGHSRVH